MMLNNPRNILGLDGDGWLRNITVNDAIVGLAILQSGAGAGLTIANAGGVKATITAAGKARFGDATAPTVSLEAASGLTVAAGLLKASGGLQLGDGIAINLGTTIGDHYGEFSTNIRFVTKNGFAVFVDSNNNTDDYFSIYDGGIPGGSPVLRWSLHGATGRMLVVGPVNLLGAVASEKTIATGVITITAGYHTVDTEGDAATDDLDTISGGRTGDLLVIVPANAARTVVAKHGTGNLNLAAGVDFTMDEDDDFLQLLLIGATWQEISRSENHA